MESALGQAAASPELGEREQRRGRLVALLSHPFSMTWRTVVTGDFATQALVTLGAREAVVGLHTALVPLASLVQLPTLSLVGRFGKRPVLLATQLVALLAALPLLRFGELAEAQSALAVALVVASLGATTFALTAGSTVWWPLLHGFVPAGGAGRFFGLLRTLWHVALLGFSAGAGAWLARHPGAFGPVFGAAWACGLVRALLVPVFPERREPRAGLDGRDALRRIAASPALRRYLVGGGLDAVVFRMVPPFAILVLRRELGLSEAETLWTTVAFYAGGLTALVPAGRLADRRGVEAVFRVTCQARAGLLLLLAAATFADGRLALVGVVGVIGVWAALSSAFGVADVKLLFRLAPPEAPTTTIVGVGVVRALLTSAAPLLAGWGLERLVAWGLPGLWAYRALFATLAVGQALAWLPLRGLQAQPADPALRGGG